MDFIDLDSIAGVHSEAILHWYFQGLAIKGWLELLCGREQQAKKAVKYFDEALAYDNIILN